MLNKKRLVMALTAFTLAATLLMVLPTRSATNPYDPWLDTNDDGKINMRDIQAAILAFGTNGNPSKPVTIAQHNFSGGYFDIPIGADQEGRLNITTAGYRQISLGLHAISMMPPPGEGNVSVAVGFLMGNSSMHINVERFNATAGWTGPERPILYEYPVARTYEIKGQSLTIAYFNPNQIGYRLIIEYYMTT